MNPVSTHAGSPVSPAAARIELSIERLVIDAPPGVRPELLRTEIERHLQAEFEARAMGPAPTAGPRETIPSEQSIQASRHPGSYAARIARTVAERIWE